MELWITFSSGGKELVAYTVEGTFAGEVAATLKSIEVERGIPQDKILVKGRHAVDHSFWCLPGCSSMSSLRPSR